MSTDAIYRNRRVARLINETSDDMNIGPRIDWGDGLVFRVNWGDPSLIVEPDDSEWESAAPMIQHRLPGIVELPDGTTGAVSTLADRAETDSEYEG